MRYVALIAVVLITTPDSRADTLFTTLYGGKSATTARAQNSPTFKILVPYLDVATANYIGNVWEFPVSPADIGTTFTADRHSLPDWYGFNRAFTDEFCCGYSFQVDLHLPDVIVGGGAPLYLLWTDGMPNPSTTIDSNFTPPNGFNMRGFHLTRMEFDLEDLVIGTTNSFTYSLRIYGDEGQVPEPSATILACFAFCGLLSLRRLNCARRALKSKTAIRG